MIEKNKRVFSALLITCLLIMLLPSVAFAAEEVTAAVSGTDAASREISITFSENIEVWPSGAELYETTSGRIISAMMQSKEGKLMTLSYSSTLEASTEYAIILKGDVFGTSGNKLASNYVYFVSDGDMTPVRSDLYDFDTKSPYTEWHTDYFVNTATGDGNHNNALKVMAKDNDTHTRLLGIDYFDATRWAVSFDVKVTKKPASFAIMLSQDTAGNKVLCNLGFSPKGRVAFTDNTSNHAWWSADQLNGVDQWFKNDILGDYPAGSWVNYRVYYDKVTSTFSVYMNDVLKLNYKTSAVFDSPKCLRFFMRNVNLSYTNKEELMWIDNIKLEKYADASKVEKVRVYNSNNVAKGVPESIGRDISKIGITFLTDVEGSQLTSDKLKLMYDNTEIGYTVEKIDDKNYSVIPQSLPGNGGKVKLRLSGVAAKDGNTIDDYEIVFNVSDSTSVFKVLNPTLVRPDGTGAVVSDGEELYLNTTLLNVTADAEDVMLSLMGYTEDNSMEVFNCIALKVPANSMTAVNNNINTLKITLPSGIKRVTATIQRNGKTREPLIESITINAEE